MSDTNEAAHRAWNSGSHSGAHAEPWPARPGPAPAATPVGVVPAGAGGVSFGVSMTASLPTRQVTAPVRAGLVPFAVGSSERRGLSPPSGWGLAPAVWPAG